MYGEILPCRPSRRFWEPPRATREELIDRFDHPAEDFRASFQDIRRINRYLGGSAVVKRHLEDLDLEGHVSILDVATGSGDIPLELIRWGRRRGLDLHFTVLDANPRVLEMASREPALRVVQASAAELPFAGRSFDVVLCSLTFHHFEESFAAHVLTEMHRIARRAVIVNDLRRGYLPASLIWLVTRLTRMHPLTRHDAPLSVMRSRTLAEYRALAYRAGLPGARVVAHPFWRAGLEVRR